MLAWPVVVSCVLLVGFAEMFYTLGQMNCSASSVEIPSLCNLREAYQMIYVLFLGESVNIGRNEPLSPGTAFLVGLFTALLGLLLLSFLVVAVVVASRCDGETFALDAYWEPKLAFVLSSQDTRAIGDDKIQKDKIQPPSFIDSLVGRLEELWGISICLVSGRDSDRYWYARSSSQPRNCCLTLLTFILIPLWLAAGLFTLGFLWPPQVRRFIFEPRRGLFDGRQTKPGNETREYFVSQVSNVRNELTKLKAMSYEQGKDVHQELQELKALLIATMKED
jgi:hypothetical protein